MIENVELYGCMYDFNNVNIECNSPDDAQFENVFSSHVG